MKRIEKSSTLFFCWLMGMGCASTYDSKRGRYVGTEDYKKDYNVERVCQAASCWDDKSGHFVSRDEWNKREQERANGNKPNK